MPPSSFHQQTSPSSPSCGHPTLELLLVTISILTSAGLSLIPSTRALTRANMGRPNALVVLASLLFAAVALLMALTSLILGWIGVIGFDALTSVVFALVPALISMPLDTFQYILFRCYVVRYTSLKPTHINFRYLSFERGGDGTSRDGQSGEGVTIDLGDVGNSREGVIGESMNVTWYIVLFPEQSLFPVSSTQEALFRYEKRLRMSELSRARRGTLLRHNEGKSLIVMRRFDTNSKARWWMNVCSSAWLVARPGMVYLNTQEQIVHALALLSDIIALGKVFLELRKDFLEARLRKVCSSPKGLSRSTRVSCNSILEHTGLGEWGSIPDNIGGEGYKYPDTNPQWYGVMFVVLTALSDVFGQERFYKDRNGREVVFVLERDNQRRMHCFKSDNSYRLFKRISAQTVLDKLEENRDNGNLQCFITAQLDEWFESWTNDDVLDRME